MPPEVQELDDPLFTFEGLAVKRVLFDHVARVQPDAGEERPKRVPLQLHIEGTATITPDRNRAVITIAVVARPDPKWQPYLIEVTVAGRFERKAGTPDQFDQFCRQGVPPILFPYVRQAVHSVSRDAMFGPVLLDPMNVQALFAEWEETTPVAATSTGPEQPSEQSPSASPETEPQP